MDVIERLKGEHREVQDLLDRFEQGRLDPMSDAVDRIVRELSIHAGVEELVVYPGVEAAVPWGEGLVTSHLQEHQLVKELLAEIEDAPAVDRIPMLGALAVYVRVHVAHEETKMFPALRQYATESQLLDMDAAVEKAEQVAPTHPHPYAPNRPPANAVADAFAALLDKARDSLSRR